MKKLLLIGMIAALMLSVFTACGAQKQTAFITGDQAQQIALDDLGITGNDVSDIHIHVGEMDQGPSFSVHFTYAQQEYEYVILAADGTILSSEVIG